ncbi:hypothetical protein [Sulfitobacter faviae]|uniref:hypothetical protein n=1 Tax=Sulfitobacter faviae TaxID=1775881 RepID=UPI00398CD441
MEPISACENICNDFSWVGPISEWLRNIAIVVGVFVAWRQLDSWRREKIAIKRGDLCEELFAATSELAAKLAHIRSPFGYGPPEGETDDGTYDYKRRLDLVAELDDDYLRLRQLKIRQKAFVGDEALDAAIFEFFKARTELLIALRGLIRARRDSVSGRIPTERALERQNRYEAIMWEGADFEGNDPIKQPIDEALVQIEERTIPLIRLELNK